MRRSYTGGLGGKAAFSLCFCLGCGATSASPQQGQEIAPLGVNSEDEADASTDPSAATGDSFGSVASVPVPAPWPTSPPVDYCGAGMIDDALAGVTDLVDCGVIPGDTDPSSDVLDFARACVLNAMASGRAFKLIDDRRNETLQARAVAYYWDPDWQKPAQLAINTSGGCGQSELIICESLVAAEPCHPAGDQLCLACQGIVETGYCCALCPM